MEYEDMRLHGCDHPAQVWLGRTVSADAEQFAIVAVHQRGRITDKPDHERSRRGDLPLCGGKSGLILPAKYNCYLPIGRAALAQIKGAQHQVEARQSIGRQRPTAWEWSRRAAEQPAVKTQQARDAREEILVERDDSGERLARSGIA